MKKVLLAFEWNNYGTAGIDFIKDMNLTQPTFAVGVFLPSRDYSALMYSYGGVPAGPLYMNEHLPTDDALLQDNVMRFKDDCVKNGIECRVHLESGRYNIRHLAEETQFADLLILCGGALYQNIQAEIEEEYILNISHVSQCPVLILSQEYKQPTNLILAYDGSINSVFAIKQFSYLFPHFHTVPVLLVFFSSEGKDIPGCSEIEELLMCYYKDVTIKRLGASYKNELAVSFKEDATHVVVAGAFGRSLISEFMRRSFTLNIIRAHNFPVFIAHK